jgi:hypothetical protein
MQQNDWDDGYQYNPPPITEQPRFQNTYQQPTQSYSNNNQEGWYVPPVSSETEAVIPPSAYPLPSRHHTTSIGFTQPFEGGMMSASLPSNTKSERALTGSNRFGLSTLEGELPLLVELGIDFHSIMSKTWSALFFFNNKKIDPLLMADGDLAGPFVICFSLGFCLLLSGKLHFGYVFGMGVIGCIGIYSILNLISSPPKPGIELFVVFSVLGYALLPMIGLALISLALPLKEGGFISWGLILFTVSWCTITATRFFESILQAREQRYLIAYPVFLFFSCFTLITVF